VSVRPSSLLPVIGWSMLAGALALLFSGLLGFRLIALARQPGPLPFPPGMEGAVDLRALLRPLERDLRILSWLQALLALPAAAVSVEFLKRKRWARAAMEVLTWVLMGLTAAFGLLTVPFTAGLFRAALALGPLDPLPGTVRLLAAAFGSLMVVLLEVPLVMNLKALRSEAMRRTCVL
jgi:hypothetical protein